MRPTIWAEGACARCLLAPPSGRRHRPSCHNHHVITSHLRYSSAKPVSKDTGRNSPPRIYFAGFGNRGALLAHAIRAVQPPLPLTLLLPSNRRFQQFVDNGGQIEIIEDGVSTIAEGFDAEVMPTQNPFSVKLYPSTKHYRLRTYAMGSRHKFDVQAEKQLEGSDLDHPRTNIDYGRRVRFGGDPATPTYGLDPTYKVLESDLLQNDEIFSNNRLLSREEAKKQQDPIDYLVLLTKPQRVVDELLRLKDRLNENSTILFAQRGMGFLEDANKVFPNPISRPSYLPGVLYHSTYSAPGKEKDQPGTRSDILQFIAKASIDSDNSISTCSFTFHHKADGKMLVSKAGIYPKGQETPKRRKAVEYLLNVLISAKKLGVDLLEPKELRHVRIRDAVVCSVVHSLSVKYNCLNGDVIKTEERIEYARKLLREAASVVQNWLPHPAYEYLEKSLGHYITVHADQINDTMDSVANGKESPIAFNNGWLVKLGKKLTPQRLCPTHELLIAEHDAILAKQVAYIQELRDEKAAKEATAWRKEQAAERREMHQEEHDHQNRHQEPLSEEEEIVREEARKRRVREKMLKDQTQLPPKPDWVRPASAMGLGNSSLVQQVLHQPSKGVRIKKIPGESAYKKTRSKAHERNSKPLTPEEWKRLRLDFKNFYNPVGSSEEARARNKRRYFRQHLFYRLKNKGGILPAGTTFSEFAHLKVDDSTPPDEALAQVEAVTARLNGAVTKSDDFERQTAAKPTSSSPTEIDVQNPSEYSEKISIPHQREASRKSKVDIREGLKRFQEVKESGILPAGITFGEFAKLNIDNGTTADEVLAQLEAVRARSNEALTKSDDSERRAAAHALGVGVAETQRQHFTQSVDPGKVSVLGEATTAP